ncbi:hypothetical protein [Aquitalea aquatilis]|uniref:hypothetical protein n=1 Tax=Aquitalea aquatilis TaxID=1537400 RepID=UPI0010BDB587|nr:hypothetical protein [Aquitalea aquatilis]
MSQSLYDFLGVQNNSGPEVIRSAINAMADRHRADGADATQARMLSLCAEILLFPEKRIEYDRHQAAKKSTVSSPSVSVERVDYGVYLLTLPIAFSSSVLFFIAMSSWPIFAKAIVSGLYSIMAVVVGIIAANEIFRNSSDNDPLPSFYMFLLISGIWPVGYIWYMSGRGRYKLKSLLVVPIIIVIVSLLSFVYPVVKVERAIQEAEQKRQQAIEQIKHDQEDLNRKADEGLRNLLSPQPSYQQ